MQARAKGKSTVRAGATLAPAHNQKHLDGLVLEASKGNLAAAFDALNQLVDCINGTCRNAGDHCIGVNGDIGHHDGTMADEVVVFDVDLASRVDFFLGDGFQDAN